MTTIANCFHKAGFSLSTTDMDDLPDTNTADDGPFLGLLQMTFLLLMIMNHAMNILQMSNSL